MKNLGIWVAWACWISWVLKPWSTNRLKWKLMGTYLCSSCHNFFPPPTKRPPVKTAAQRSLWLWLRVLGLCISESHPEVPSIIHLKSNFTSFHLLRNDMFFFAFDPLRFAFELISYYHWLIVIYQSMTQKKRRNGQKEFIQIKVSHVSEWLSRGVLPSDHCSVHSASLCGRCTVPSAQPAARRSLCGVSRGSSKSLAGLPQGFVQDSKDSD